MKKKILLAEDDTVMQQLFRILLERKGLEATIVGNGREAVDLFDGEFDVILLDIEMPVMNGMQAAETIRRMEKGSGKARTPLLAVTAHASAKDDESFRAAGFDDCVVKPLEFAAFFATLEKHLH